MSEAAQERLAVLSRQLTSGFAVAQLAVDVPALRSFLVHDNPELRQAIYEFLKVGRRRGRFGRAIAPTDPRHVSKQLRPSFPSHTVPCCAQSPTINSNSNSNVSSRPC
jgi:hypothetical protein